VRTRAYYSLRMGSHCPAKALLADQIGKAQDLFPRQEQRKAAIDGSGLYSGSRSHPFNANSRWIESSIWSDLISDKGDEEIRRKTNIFPRPLSKQQSNAPHVKMTSDAFFYDLS
jgi:hypothetical protein